jgi:hypothetical protein
MRKTTLKKAKQSPRVRGGFSKPAKPVSAVPTVPADPITFNDPFPVNIHKPDTTANTTSLAPESERQTSI